jgi:Rad3-related DNA helicase
MVKKGGKVVSTCEFKAPNPDGQCAYYEQKERGLARPRTILNYAMYFSLKKFQSDTAGIDRQVAIFDEAHTIEGEVVRFVGYDIPGGYLAETGLDQRRFDIESVQGMLNLLGSLKDAYAELIRRSPDPVTTSDVMRMRRLDRRLEGVVNARRDIGRDERNFIMQEPEFDAQGNLNRISVVPLDISEYTRDLLDSEIQVFMSATIDKDNFSKSIGIENCALVDVPKSPFPAENRMVEFRNVARLSSRSPESDEIRVANSINDIMAAHQDSRGLILTSSKARCYNLLKRLTRQQARRIEIAHSKNENNASLGDVLAAHRDTPNGVLLSSSLWQGIDLKGDLSRFQIIEKCPYPYLGDNRVAAKNRADRGWYVYQTIVKLLQGMGRSVRDVDDRADTYVMDSSVQELLRQHRTMVPVAYHDVLFAR